MKSLLIAALIVIPLAGQPLTIDGNLTDAFWRSVAPKRLTPAEEGAPADMGGEARVARRDGYLCLAARLRETGGKVLARSLGRNPQWETDDPNSPPVEDLVRFSVGDLAITINPLGAHRIERNGTPVGDIDVFAAATINSEGWTVEAALPLRAQTSHVEVERVRSRRPLHPEVHWRANVEASSVPGPAPEFDPPALGNADPPLEVGRIPSVPPMPEYLDPSSPDWDDPAWQAIPSFELPRNEPYPRPPRYPTQVKWAHDGETLALLVRVAEPGPLAADRGGRDARIEGDDHFGIRFATSGPHFLEILVNSSGAIRDWRGGNIHSVRRPDTSWNADIKVQTNIRHGVWIARINLPLRDLAKALGEPEMPREWRVLLSRYRAGRPGEAAEVSALPPVGTDTFYGPLRYRRMTLSVRSPSQVALPEPVRLPEKGLAGEVAALDPRVWSALERRSLGARGMVRRQQRRRAEKAILAERLAWEEIRTLAGWERFRGEKLERLREALGLDETQRVPLDVHVSATHRGRGYQLLNLVYQSRPGFYVSANLYLPAQPSPPMPAIIIQHSFHYPKTQGELQDMGQLWARTGCAVLTVERLGFGERIETAAWYRYGYRSRHTFKKQLDVVGQTHMGWMAWDLIRGVDMLLARGDIDEDKLILIGSVAGGGEPAAIAAALDPRIDALVPFNYDHGRVWLDADFPGELTEKLTMSFVVNSVAPRKYVRASEFGWEGAEQTEFPNLWVDAWERNRKIWKLYDAQENLASIQGYGMIRLSMERVSHCWSVGHMQRVELYPILKRWFGIPMPSEEALSILPDSQSSVNPYREQARRMEAERRRPVEDLLSIPPSMSAKLSRRSMHDLAREMAKEQLRAAHARGNDLREALREKLGDIDPNRSPLAKSHGTRDLSGVVAEALSIEVEDGVFVPLLLLRPQTSTRVPAVVAITKGGKDRFLKNGAEAVAKLLESGVAVALPDVRGTGETAPAPDWQNDGSGLWNYERALGNTILGARLKDLRTVLVYLRGRSEIDSRRIGLWGDAFAPANPPDMRMDEFDWQTAPQIQHHSEPMGAALALFAALYEEDVAVVAAQRGIAGYLSLLNDGFVYAPMDIVVHGILEAGDIADVAAALAPRPLLLAGLVNGRNIRLDRSTLDGVLDPASRAYQQAQAADRLTVQPDPMDAAAWLAERLTR